MDSFDFIREKRNSSSNGNYYTFILRKSKRKDICYLSNFIFFM